MGTDAKHLEITLETQVESVNLAEEGIEYVSDWVNDDQPYEIRTTAGPLVSAPMSPASQPSTLPVPKSSQTGWCVTPSTITGSPAGAKPSGTKIGASRGRSTITE